MTAAEAAAAAAAVVCRDGGWSLESVLRYVDGIRGARCHSSEPPLGGTVGQLLRYVPPGVRAASGDVVVIGQSRDG